MSGFVGIFHRDGRPVDAAQLQALTASLSFRGPDGLKTWQHGSAGLGHSLFVTNRARNGEPQPIALGDSHIVGDIRLDGRQELVSALTAAGANVPREAQDAALVLRAYGAWGKDCLQRVHGEFSFSIWDGERKQLFCARDPFGTRPFFYAEFPDLLLASNTLKCLRAHPRVGAELDELAIADFLVCGYQLDLDRSFFRDIRRLPGGHWMVANAGEIRVQKFASLPEGPELRYPRPEQYVEHFAEVLSGAVADRIGDGPTGISLSGGLDSGAIAAVVTGKLGGRPRASALAFTNGWNCAFEDREPEFAQITAKVLELPLEVHEAQDCRPFKEAKPAPPEPADDPYRAEFLDSVARIATRSRVNLDGQGGDEVFIPQPVLAEACRAPSFTLAKDVIASWVRVRRPPIGLRRRPSPPLVPPSFLDPSWCNTLGLNTRYGSADALPSIPREKPRAAARARLLSKIWQPCLECFDAGYSGVPLQTSWPYLDHRLVGFCLSLPPFPWCLDKELSRRALRPHLPVAITGRRKAALAGFPLDTFLSRDPSWQAGLELPPKLAGWIDPSVWCSSGREPAYVRLRPFELAQWLNGAPQGCHS